MCNSFVKPLFSSIVVLKSIVVVYRGHNILKCPCLIHCILYCTTVQYAQYITHPKNRSALIRKLIKHVCTIYCWKNIKLIICHIFLTCVSCGELSSGSRLSTVPSLVPCGCGGVLPRLQGSISGPLSPSSWMSVVRLTDIFLRERERVGVGEGDGCGTQELLRENWWEGNSKVGQFNFKKGMGGAPKFLRKRENLRYTERLYSTCRWYQIWQTFTRWVWNGTTVEYEGNPLR